MIGSRRFNFCLEYSLSCVSVPMGAGSSPPSNGHQCMNMDNLLAVFQITDFNFFVPLDFKSFNINPDFDELGIFSNVNISPIPYYNTYNVEYLSVNMNCFNDVIKVFSEVLRVNCKNDEWDEVIVGVNTHWRIKDFYTYRNREDFSVKYVYKGNGFGDIYTFSIRIKQCLN